MHHIFVPPFFCFILFVGRKGQQLRQRLIHQLAQASLKLVIHPRVTSNAWCSCLYFLSVRIKNWHNHAWLNFIFQILKSYRKFLHVLGKTQHYIMLFLVATPQFNQANTQRKYWTGKLHFERRHIPRLYKKTMRIRRCWFLIISMKISLGYFISTFSFYRLWSSCHHLSIIYTDIVCVYTCVSTLSFQYILFVYIIHETFTTTNFKYILYF